MIIGMIISRNKGRNETKEAECNWMRADRWLVSWIMEMYNFTCVCLLSRYRLSSAVVTIHTLGKLVQAWVFLNSLAVFAQRASTAALLRSMQSPLLPIAMYLSAPWLSQAVVSGGSAQFLHAMAGVEPNTLCVRIQYLTTRPWHW